MPNYSALKTGHLAESEGLSCLPEGKLAGAESQREMAQDNVEFVCQGAVPLKTEPCS